MEVVGIVHVAPGAPDDTLEPTPGGETIQAVDDCTVWLSTSDERLEVGLAETTEMLTVSFPFGTVVTADQAVVVRGERYQVVADGFAWKNTFSGSSKGVVAKVKKVAPNG